MRINVGVPPSVLSDQHLIAERRELGIPFGTIRSHLKKNKLYYPKTVPDEFCLNTGHINFFLVKLPYVLNRFEIINEECKLRGFASQVPEYLTDISDIPQRFLNEWSCKFNDSVLIRMRLCDRLRNPLNAKEGFHKFWRQPIIDFNLFCENIKNSKLSI